MLTGYLTTLPTDCLLSAGVLFCAKGGVSAKLGVTEGAPEFDDSSEPGEIMFDNRAPSRLKGLARTVGFSPVFKGTLKELGGSTTGGQIAILEPGISEATVSGVVVETPKATALFAAGDYIVDFRWVFERAGGGYAAIYAPLAICRKWTKKGVDKKEAQISFEIEAVGDPVNDLGNAPYTIELRTILPSPIDGSISDVTSHVGSSNILRWADVTISSTVTLSSGRVTAIGDARGAGFGPNFVGFGSAGPTIGGDGGAVVTGSSDQYMQWPSSQDFNLQTQADFWIAAVIAVANTTGNPVISIDDGSTGFGASAQALGIGCRSDTTPHFYDFNNFHGPTWTQDSQTLWNPNRTPCPSDAVSYRLVILERHKGPGTQQGVFNEIRGYEVYGSPRVIQFDSGTTEPDYVSEAGVLTWGRESGLTTSASSLKALLFGIGVLPASARQSLWRYAQRLGALQHATANAVAAVPTKLVTISHDSNSAGYGTSNTDTKAWPVLMQAALNTASPNTYLVKQDGWAGTTALDHDGWLSRITLPQINTQVIPKHVHIVGTQVTNDLEAVIPANSAAAIIGALQSQCTQAKAAGAKVLLFTCPRSPSNNETSIPAMGVVNTWCRTAVANGYADDLYDIYTAIGAAAGDPHFNDAQNAQIATDVQTHVVALAA